MPRDEYNVEVVLNERENPSFQYGRNQVEDFSRGQRNEYSASANEIKEHKEETNDGVIPSKKIKGGKTKVISSVLSHDYVSFIIVSASTVGLLVAGTNIGFTLFPTKESNGESGIYYPIFVEVDGMSANIEMELPFSYFEEFNEETNEPIIQEGEFIARFIGGLEDLDESCSYEIGMDEQLVYLYGYTELLEEGTSYTVAIYDYKNEEYKRISEEYAFTTEGTPEIYDIEASSIDGGYASLYIVVPYSHFSNFDDEGNPIYDENLFVARYTTINEPTEQDIECYLENDSEEGIVYVYFSIEVEYDVEYSVNVYELVDNEYKLITNPYTFTHPSPSPIQISSVDVYGTDISIMATVPYSYFEDFNDDGTPLIQETQFISYIYLASDETQPVNQVGCDYDFGENEEYINLYANFTDLEIETDYVVIFTDTINNVSSAKENVRTETETQQTFTVNVIDIGSDTASFYIEIPYNYFSEIDSSTGHPIIGEEQFDVFVSNMAGSYYFACTTSFNDTNETVTVQATADGLAPQTEYSIVFRDMIDNEKVEISESYSFTTTEA